jgi:hypothetical protein
MAAAPALAFNIDDPPEKPELHASRQKLKDLLQPSYWQVMLVFDRQQPVTAAAGAKTKLQASCRLPSVLQLAHVRKCLLTVLPTDRGLLRVHTPEHCT